VHPRRFGKAKGATHEMLDAGPQLKVFARDCLHGLFSHLLLLGVEIPLVGTSSIGIEARETKRLQQSLPLQKAPILAVSTDISQHLSTGMIHRVPQPPLVRFLADITPHLIEFGCQPAPLFKLVCATPLHLHLLRMYRL
jgi:hypothetical protein